LQEIINEAGVVAQKQCMAGMVAVTGCHTLLLCGGAFVFCFFKSYNKL
jgi:hypothetical protein